MAFGPYKFQNKPQLTFVPCFSRFTPLWNSCQHIIWGNLTPSPLTLFGHAGPQTPAEAAGGAVEGDPLGAAAAGPLREGDGVAAPGAARGRRQDPPRAAPEEHLQDDERIHFKKLKQDAGQVKFHVHALNKVELRLPGSDQRQCLYRKMKRKGMFSKPCHRVTSLRYFTSFPEWMCAKDERTV